MSRSSALRGSLPLVRAATTNTLAAMPSMTKVFEPESEPVQFALGWVWNNALVHGVIERGLALGVDYSITSTCYDPAPSGAACGRCEACLLRLKGFREAGMEDPAPYQKVRTA